MDGGFHIVILPLLPSNTQALDAWELSCRISPAPADVHTGAWWVGTFI